MRVIAGRLRGRRVDAPRGKGVRPTYDRVRESVFSIIDPRLPDASVLDLFAGSGVLGIECLSRGARRATFVELAPGAVEVIAQNLERLGLENECAVERGDALVLIGGRLPGEPFDIVFVDPPYESGLHEELLLRLGGWDGLGPGAVVVVEHAAATSLGESYGRLARLRTKRYGASAVDIFEADATAASEKEEA